MKLKYCLILEAALISLLPSLLWAESPIGPGAAGEPLFRQYCSSCHGADGSGDGPMASQLRIAVPNLQLIAARRQNKFPEAEVTAIIDGRTEVASHGSREMPVWGRQFSKSFGGDEIGEEAARGYLTALVTYLKSIQK